MISEKRRFLRTPMGQTVDVWFLPNGERKTGLLKDLSLKGAAVSLYKYREEEGSPEKMRLHIAFGDEHDFLFEGNVVRKNGNLMGLEIRPDFMEEMNLKKALDEFVRAARKCA